MRKSSAIALLLLCVSLTTYAQTSVPAKLEQYMERYTTFNDFGGAVLVLKGDKALLKKAYGLADREWGVANTVDTKFRIASIAKPFTAVAILKLVEQNKLSLDDTLEKHLPGFPGGDRITLHMMLTHSSGLPNSHGADVATDMAMTREKALEILKKKPLAFEPGSKSGYSNTAYLLLSWILEKVTGESYADFLQKHVLQPASLHNTGVYSPESILSRKAKHYRPENAAPGNRVENERWVNYAMFQGHGNLYSTVDDLARFLHALRGTTLLSEASTKKMLSTHGEGSDWGYGIDLTPLLERKAFGHGGSYNGAAGNAIVYPEEELTVVLLSNHGASANPLSQALAAIVFGREVEMPYEHVRVNVDPALVEKYAGNYDGGVIFSKDGKLRLSDTVELVPESATKFFESTNPNLTYEFVVGADGKVSAVLFGFYGVKRSIPRSR